MTISDKHVVAVSYHLTVPGNEGAEETVEETRPEEPFVFLFGAGGLLPEFERNLSGKSVGDNFDFRISAKEGYGEYQLDHVISIPIESFLDENGKLDSEMIAVGNTVPMVDGEGHRLFGKVLEVGLEQIRMDFNHPLAGKDLHFKGEVLQIRAATEDELSHGHAHGMDGEHHHH